MNPSPHTTDADLPTAEPIIHYIDCSNEVKQVILDTAKLAYQAKEKSDFQYWQQCAELIKKELDAQFTPTWHCIVGSSYGSFISHEAKHVCFLQIGQMKILAFKHG